MTLAAHDITARFMEQPLAKIVASSLKIVALVEHGLAGDITDAADTPQLGWHGIRRRRRGCSYAQRSRCRRPPLVIGAVVAT